MMRTRPAFEISASKMEQRSIKRSRLFDKDAALQHANDCFAALFQATALGIYP